MPTPNPKVEIINSSLVKVTLFSKKFLSSKFNSRELFWRKMVDNNTGEFLFFTNKSNYIKNTKAQEAIEKLIK